MGAPASVKSAATSQAGASAGVAGEEKKTLMDLAEAEQRVIANLKTASQLMQSLNGALNGQGQGDVQALTKSYVESVQVSLFSVFLPMHGAWWLQEMGGEEGGEGGERENDGRMGS